MKPLLRNDILPINLLAGDSVQLEFVDEDGKSSVVSSHTVTENHHFDEAMIFALDEDEMAKLGVKDGIGGVFMEKDK